MTKLLILTLMNNLWIIIWNRILVNSIIRKIPKKYSSKLRCTCPRPLRQSCPRSTFMWYDQMRNPHPRFNSSQQRLTIEICRTLYAYHVMQQHHFFIFTIRIPTFLSSSTLRWFFKLCYKPYGFLSFSTPNKTKMFYIIKIIEEMISCWFLILFWIKNIWNTKPYIYPPLFLRHWTALFSIGNAWVSHSNRNKKTRIWDGGIRIATPKCKSGTRPAYRSWMVQPKTWFSLWHCWQKSYLIWLFI